MSISAWWQKLNYQKEDAIMIDKSRFFYIKVGVLAKLLYRAFAHHHRPPLHQKGPSIIKEQLCQQRAAAGWESNSVRTFSIPSQRWAWILSLFCHSLWSMNRISVELRWKSKSFEGVQEGSFYQLQISAKCKTFRCFYKFNFCITSKFWWVLADYRGQDAGGLWAERNE